MPEATILIIDDEAGIVKLCERLLQRANFKTLSALEPEAGLALLKQEPVNLLLVDIRMPDMDGFEVIEQARRQQPDIGAVIMTGYGTLETAIHALRLGADGLILKPFAEGEELVQTVREAMEARKQKQELARLKAVRPLLDMTETLYTETRYEKLLYLIVDAICGHLRCEYAAIYKEEREKIERLAGRGEAFSETSSAIGEGLVRLASMQDLPTWVNAEGPGDAGLQEALHGQGLGGVICVPVRRGEKKLIFAAGRVAGQAAFDQAEGDILSILARQANLALENARLYGELWDYVRQVEASQRALTQAEKMAAVGRLTASIAHEVNNPLQSVSNCLHLALREDLSPSERQEYLQMAETELTRLMQTVQRMLDFYRPGGANREATELQELVSGVLKLMEKQLESQKVAVNNRLPADLPRAVVVRNQIQQVFFNLILNAMEAMPEGGELTIEGKANGKQVEISFQDTGEGVPEEAREHIFEPFNSTRDTGTGLGLSVSYGIIVAHGGHLELVAKQKKGACFLVALPTEEAT